MATQAQMVGLVQAFNEGDPDKFKTIVLQLAAGESAKGHYSVARDLKAEADKINSQMVRKESKSEFCEVSSTQSSRRNLSNLFVPQLTKDRLERIIFEYRRMSNLGQHGLNPSRKILLEGCPGAGKTLTAATLAGELRLPLCTIMLNKLLAHDPEKVGSNFARLNLEIFSNQAVYLFDTFDSLLADRDASDKVGSYALHEFLQMLEHDDSKSMIIVTTNHKELLGREILCHFDEVIPYALPAKDEIRGMIERLKRYDASFVMTEDMWEEACGLSMSEIDSACDIAAKQVVLNGKKLSENMMISLFKEKHAGH